MVLVFFLFVKYYKNINEKLDKIQQRTEPIQEPPDTARVDRGTAVQMNCYYDQNRNVFEVSPKEN